MKILLVRHADALPAAGGMTDAERPLSGEGRENMHRAASGLGVFFPSLEVVLTSPLLRAVETARILAMELNGSEDVLPCPPLGGPFGWTDLLPYLDDHGSTSCLALVGHEPTMGYLAGWLLAPDGSTSITMKKGSILGFEVDGPVPAPRARLLWFMTSRQLGMIR